MPIRRLWLALAGAGLCAGAAAAPQLIITTELSPPTSMLENGRVIGSATERVRGMLERSDISYTITMFPWKRAYSAALSHPFTCVYSTTRTPERESLFKWAGPTAEGEWVLMGRADREYHLRSVEDARGLRVGTYFGDARDDYLRERGIETDPAHNDLINPQKLMMGRIDLWAASMRGSVAWLERNGLAGKIVPVLVFNRVKVYLACNRSVPDAVIHKMNAALETMGRDGTLRRIDKTYENWTEH
ncbi:MAG TPA: transporter substrate-binding domain-containing protein [Telluria sp.]|nr:transporter substrate-binding domain-containing protein [Telluria sp.]